MERWWMELTRKPQAKYLGLWGEKQWQPLEPWHSHLTSGLYLITGHFISLPEYDTEAYKEWRLSINKSVICVSIYGFRPWFCPVFQHFYVGVLISVTGLQSCCPWARHNQPCCLRNVWCKQYSLPYLKVVWMITVMVKTNTPLTVIY